MKTEKPLRGSHPPRSFWSYNNWDFNALGTIYEKLTHDTIYHRFVIHYLLETPAACGFASWRSRRRISNSDRERWQQMVQAIAAIMEPGREQA